MQSETFHAIAALLASTDPAEIHRGLEQVKAQLPSWTQDEARPVLDMIIALFYIDPLDLPGHVPVLEEAIAVAASFGPWAIPVLIGAMEGGDVKAQMAIAQALGRMGADAIQPLIAEYRSACPEPGCRAFVLYAMGKIKSPRIVEAAPVALEAAASSDLELRDSATRAIGKFAESIPPRGMPAALRDALVEQLTANLADASPGIRAKAVRSLGKLAKYGHLTKAQRGQLKRTLRRILGEDGRFEWDRAFVVRKEAQEALGYV